MPEMDDSPIRGKAQEVQRLAAEAEAEAISEGGAVRVVVGPAGNIKELDLRNHAFEMSGVELGEMIVETLRQATGKVTQELAAQIEQIMGMGTMFGGNETETGR